jgi:creatinine amidohydrolase
MDNDKVLMEQMSWQEIEEAIAGGKTTVIMGIAAIEEHGPHLPTGTDTYLWYALAEGIAHELGDALVAPVMPVGLSEALIGFPGTMTLTQETFMRVLMEYCISLAGHGFKDIVLISGHGGNHDTMVAFHPRIAKALRDRCRVHMVPPHIVAEQRAEFGDIYREYGRTVAYEHAAFAETSMMLALHPELVDMSRAEEGYTDEALSHPERDPERLKRGSIERFVYGIRSQSPNGILGDPRGAQAEAGRRLMEARIKEGAEEVRRMISAAKER